VGAVAAWPVEISPGREDHPRNRAGFVAAVGVGVVVAEMVSEIFGNW